MRRGRGLLGAASGVAAAGAGALLLADRRAAQQRREGIRGQAAFVAPPSQRGGSVITNDGVLISYEQDGAADAAVTVVAVHGFCLTRDTYMLLRRDLAARCEGRVRVVAYDQRSHGRSGRSARDHATIDQLGDDLRAVIEAVAPDGPLVLVGHSMGGMTIMALADAHPELFGESGRVRGVLLASTSTGRMASVTLGLPAGVAKLKGPLPLLLRGTRPANRLVERGRAGLADAAWVFVKRLSFGPDVDPALVEFVASMIAGTAVDVVADFFPALMNHDKLVALDRLVGVPLVVLCGDDDLVTPPAHSRAIAAAVAGSRLITVPGAGHMALLERPGLMADAVADLVSAAQPARRVL